MKDVLEETIVYRNTNIVIKREDLLHPIISGNKYRKLKYNIEEAKKQQKKTLVTFGGAFSNHILALAGAGMGYGFDTIGIIRGEELTSKINENPTLSKAQELGMKLFFVTRDDYRDKVVNIVLEQLNLIESDIYLIPEGGTNQLAITGCEEILTAFDKENFSHVCCAVGTGGTISGLINSSYVHQKIIGFSSLKGDFLIKDINIFANQKNWELNTDYHFGGYGKVSDELVEFINDFKSKYQIPLDPIYTGKMMYGIFDLIKKEYFPENAKILAIHTGGLQGIEGINLLRSKQNKTTIQ